MFKSDLTSLDYFELVKRAKALSSTGCKPLRIALLGDVSTQHLVPLLRVLLAEHGFEAQIYEAGYDTVEVEALDPSSGLFGFDPQVVCILQSTQKLRSAFHQWPGDRGRFPGTRARDIQGVWNAIRERSGASIVQSTFVVPYDRPFGNYDYAVNDSLHHAALELNRELKLLARDGNGIFVNDIDYVAAWVGRRQFVDEKLWALSKSICALEFLPEVAQNIVDIVVATQGRAIKCVVLDLDNTLWGGVIGDDGLDGIEIGASDETGAFRNFQLYLKELGRRGIILAVCSKNDEGNARRVFREHPGMVLRETDIAVFVANWNDKASNIRLIREKLNIGFDSMVFLDDSAFERNLVRQLIPEIVVPELPEDPSLYVRAVTELNLFETASFSLVDTFRGVLYLDQTKRDEERAHFGSLDDYLKSLETTAEVERFTPKNLPRIAQLIQRSNQFNLTTRRYSQADCETLMRDEARCYPFSISVHDRFGDFGLINIVILRHLGVTLEIDSFIMSCRVLQRGVEQLAMNRIFEYACRIGARSVVGRYIPSAKNAMVKAFYERFRFAPIESSETEGVSYSLDVEAYETKEVFIRDANAQPREAAA
jgi:FkbH-like protein